MAYPEVNQETVYLTAGAPLPSVIDGLLVCALNDNFNVAYNTFLKVQNVMANFSMSATEFFCMFYVQMHVRVYICRR